MDMQLMKSQLFGVEIEFYKFSSSSVCSALVELFKAEAGRGVYASGRVSTVRLLSSNVVVDMLGRTWSFVSDASLSSLVRSIELVTPKLSYADIPLLQKVIRCLRMNGAKVSSCCGMHVHIDGSNHTAKSLRNLVALYYSKSALINKSLVVDSVRLRYCRDLNSSFVSKLKASKSDLSLTALGELWYDDADFIYRCRRKYDNSRYSALNLHAFWYHGTVEFRAFNSTLHAGVAKAYIHLCLALSAEALSKKYIKFSPFCSSTGNLKNDMRVWLVHLALNGDEFKSTRLHLLSKLPTMSESVTNIN